MGERAAGYAAGIVEVARAEGALDVVSDELFRFAALVAANDDLRQTIGDQTLPPARRQAVVEELLGSKVSPLTTSIVSFLVSTGRAREMGDIVRAVVDSAAASRQHVVAEVRAAVELSVEQRDRLARALSANLGRDVEVKVIVDPSVMGGILARVGDVVIDGTVRHRLDQLKEAI